MEGVVAGAASGGLLGGLFGWGISKRYILKYEEHLSGGRHLVAINGTWEEVEQAHELLKNTGVYELQTHKNINNETISAI